MKMTLKSMTIVAGLAAGLASYTNVQAFTYESLPATHTPAQTISTDKTLVEIFELGQMRPRAKLLDKLPNKK